MGIGWKFFVSNRVDENEDICTRIDTAKLAEFAYTR